MGDYDQAERYAIKRLDPAGVLRWLLAGLDADLVFTRWLETQLAPFPGEPDRRPDCVAEFVSSSGTHPPWACLVEPQGQAQADFIARVVQYLMMLRTELRTGWRDQDRYLMMAGIVNVSEGKLESAADWRPPGVVGVGLTVGVWVKNVYDEPAGATLEEIAAGRVARCLLPWVPAMAGGESADVIARWKELAGQEADRQLRKTYAGLALVFADKRKRMGVWERALEDWDVEESTIGNKWRAKARAEGREQGMILGILRTRFGEPLPPRLVDLIEEERNLDRLAQCRQMAATASLDQVESYLQTSSRGAGA